MGSCARTPWLHRKPKKPLQPVAIGHDGPRRSPLLEGGRNPGINIGGRGLRQVLIQGGLPARGHEHCEHLRARSTWSCVATAYWRARRYAR